MGVAPPTELVHPLRINTEPGVFLDDIGFVAEHLADEPRDALLGTQLPAELLQHLVEDTVRDAFGVDEDTVTVEEDGGEFRKCGHAPILPPAADAESQGRRHATPLSRGTSPTTAGAREIQRHTAPTDTAVYSTRAVASAQMMMTSANSVSQAPAGRAEPCARI